MNVTFLSYPQIVASTPALRPRRTSAGAVAFLISLLAGLFVLAPTSAFSQPELVKGPTTEELEAPGAKMNFIFSEPMERDGIDVTWRGEGIDPAKFSCHWFDPLPGFPIPAQILECTYAERLPANVEVTYIFNQGDSGIMRSVLGDALPETEGSFRTPLTGGGDPDPCEGNTDGVSAAITFIKEVNYLQTSMADPTLDPDPFRKPTVTSGVFSGTNILVVEPTSATLKKPDGTTIELVEFSFDFPGFPAFAPNFFLSSTPAPEITSPSFDTEEAMETAYPNGVYEMIIGRETGAPVTVTIPFNPTPAVPTPKIVNFDTLQQFDVTQPLTIQWAPFAGATAQDGISLSISEKDGAVVFFAPDPCVPIELAPTDTSITVPANTFKTNTTYELELGFSRSTHSGTNNFPGFVEFAGFTRTTRLFIGAPDSGSGEPMAEITTVVREESGAIRLTVEGTLAPNASSARIEGSTDLLTWSEVTTVTRNALEAGGGVAEVMDPGPATTPTPYKFYRIAF